jgi:hypothetical protein
MDSATFAYLAAERPPRIMMWRSLSSSSRGGKGFGPFSTSSLYSSLEEAG